MRICRRWCEGLSGTTYSHIQLSVELIQSAVSLQYAVFNLDSQRCYSARRTGLVVRCCRHPESRRDSQSHGDATALNIALREVALTSPSSSTIASLAPQDGRPRRAKKAEQARQRSTAGSAMRWPGWTGTTGPRADARPMASMRRSPIRPVQRRRDAPSQDCRGVRPRYKQGRRQAPLVSRPIHISRFATQADTCSSARIR